MSNWWDTYQDKDDYCEDWGGTPDDEGNIWVDGRCYVDADEDYEPDED